MRSSVFCLALTLLAALRPVWGFADETGITAKLHSWGLFDPGAWKTVRVITETLNEQGQVISTSVTDSTTTLVDIDRQGVTLEIRACMEVAGKRFEAEPQTVKQAFYGELLGHDVQLKESTAGEVVIDGQKIACTVERIESTIPSGKTTATVYYSTAVAPYILKRKSVTTDPEGNPLSEASLDVTALNVPLEASGETKNGVQVKTVQKNGNGVATTLAVVAPNVPGGVVSNRSEEIDKSGRLVRRSTLRLIDYSADPQKDRGLLRKRAPRRAKQPARYGQ